MRVDIILADAAQSSDGKVSLLGGGWSICGPGPMPMAVVIFIEVPWDQTNEPFEFALELFDADGQAVMLPGAEGMELIRVEGQLEAGRPPGLLHGTPVVLPPQSIQFGPMPLDPGRYVWRFSIDGETKETWQRGFTKTAAPIS